MYVCMYVRTYVRMFHTYIHVCVGVSVCLSVGLSVSVCERVYLVPLAVVERVHVDDAGMQLAVPLEQAQAQLLTHVPHHTWLSAIATCPPSHSQLPGVASLQKRATPLICSTLCSYRRHCRLLSSDCN